MKLITNSPHDSILGYFKGIEDPSKGTIDSPFVFSEVQEVTGDETGRVTLGKMYDSSECKYLAFKVLGDVDYVISSNVAVDILIYDYVNRVDEEVKHGVNAIQRGIVGQAMNDYGEDGWASMTLYFETPRILLARVSKHNYNDYFYDDVKLEFSNCPVEFDYSERWVRDWMNRVDGSSWEING